MTVNIIFYIFGSLKKIEIRIFKFKVYNLKEQIVNLLHETEKVNDEVVI